MSSQASTEGTCSPGCCVCWRMDVPCLTGLFFAHHRILIAFKPVWQKKESKRGCSLSKVTLKGQPVNSAVWSEPHMVISSRDKSPPSLTPSFEKLAGIIRGFSRKCDNGNLDWIIVDISTPFGKQIRRKISGDPVKVERIPLSFWWNTGLVPLWHRGHLWKNSYNTRI